MAARVVAQVEFSLSNGVPLCNALLLFLSHIYCWNLMFWLTLLLQRVRV